MAVFFAPGQAPQHVAKNVLKIRAQATDIDESGTTLLAELEEGAILKGVFLRRAQDFGGTQSATIRTVGALGTEGSVVMTAGTNVENAVRNAPDFPILADEGGMNVVLDFEQTPLVQTETQNLDLAALNAGTDVGGDKIVDLPNKVPTGTVIQSLTIVRNTRLAPDKLAFYIVRSVGGGGFFFITQSPGDADTKTGSANLPPAPGELAQEFKIIGGAGTLTAGDINCDYTFLSAPVDDPQEYLQIILYVESA